MNDMDSEVRQTEILWKTVLGEVELAVPHATFVTWFKPTKLLDLDGQKLRVAVTNFFAKTQFEKKFDQQIKKILKEQGFDAPVIEYVIASHDKTAKSSTKNSEVILESKARQLAAEERQVVHAEPTNPSGLNPRYRFDNFIVGNSNDLAHAAAQAAAANPGLKYNPIFIYGGVGLGKTHLIQAIGNEILAKFPEKRVLYATAETFGNEFIDFVRYKKNRDFSRKYRDTDVLIIDDIQFIAGKKSTQEEFFNTFNDLHQANKQIVLSADRPPAEIPDLTDRLKSRFGMGMAIDVSLPDYETRSAIIEAKCAAAQTELPDDVVQFLADQIRTNIRDLEGALNQILAYCEMRGETPNLELAKGLLGNIKESRPKHLTPKQVVDKTAAYFQLRPEEICSQARDRYIAEPRQMAMYLLRSELHMSFPKIAHELGRKDHTTAIHSIEKIELAIKLDARIRKCVLEIREKLYA
jgi:chromosomal replication initiator protein